MKKYRRQTAIRVIEHSNNTDDEEALVTGNEDIQTNENISLPDSMVESITSHYFDGLASSAMQEASKLNVSGSWKPDDDWRKVLADEYTAKAGHKLDVYLEEKIIRVKQQFHVVLDVSFGVRVTCPGWSNGFEWDSITALKKMLNGHVTGDILSDWFAQNADVQFNEGGKVHTITRRLSEAETNAFHQPQESFTLDVVGHRNRYSVREVQTAL